MSRTKLFAIPLVIILLMVSAIGTAVAVPPLPSSFYGEIHFQTGDGAPSAGDTISVLCAWGRRCSSDYNDCQFNTPNLCH